jgi:AcrR family transcriptional regulator
VKPAHDSRNGGDEESSFTRRFFRRMPGQSRSRAVVDAIVTAFDDLLRKDPEGDVNLESVVARAGVGIGSFYEYFANRDSLLGVIIEKPTRENFRTLLAELDAKGGSLEDRTRVLGRAVTQTYLAHPGRTRAIIGGIARLGLMPRVGAERDRFASELASRMRRDFPSTDVRDLEATIRMLCDAAMGIAGAELYRPSQREMSVIAAELTELGLAMLRARHGAEAR